MRSLLRPSRRAILPLLCGIIISIELVLIYHQNSDMYDRSAITTVLTDFPNVSCPVKTKQYPLENHPVIAVITYNRAHQLNQTLYELLCKSGARRERVIVMSDADNDKDLIMTDQIAHGYGVHLQYSIARNSVGTIRKDKNKVERLTDHFQFIFRFIFGSYPGQPTPWEDVLKQPKAEYLVVLEDDLAVSRDFVDYFAKLSGVMDKDPSIFCVSAWNDVGQEGSSDRMS